MSINKIQLALIGVIILGVMGVIIFFTRQQVNPLYPKRLKVTTSFYPLEFLAESIGGANVTVINLTPPGVEPHDFEPSTRDIVNLESQDIILLNGGGLEGYAGKIKDMIDPKKTNLVFVGEKLMSNPQDPHVWLDPQLYKKEAEVVADSFVQKDPLHAAFYISNLKKVLSSLDSLDGGYKLGLQNCVQKDIITSHKAFGYLALRYGLNQIALTGFSPDEEPSSQTLVSVTKIAEKNKINYIFFEALVSPRIAETIAKEVGAQTISFNPLEGLTKEDIAARKTYMSIQRDNLHHLQIALNCKNP